MQQTKTYQLNKIDMDDTFSTAPLNENMDKLDTTLSLLEGANGALNSRIATLEGRKIVVGTYTGTGVDPNHISLGFTPIAVIVQSANAYAGMGIRGTTIGSIEVETGGFKARDTNSAGYYNSKDRPYTYCAIL